MKIHFSSSRGKSKSNFSLRISRDRDSCQGLTLTGELLWGTLFVPGTALSYEY